MQRMDTALVLSILVRFILYVLWLVCFDYIDISLVLSVLVRFILYVLDTEIVHTFDHLLVSDHLVSLRFLLPNTGYTNLHRLAISLIKTKHIHIITYKMSFHKHPYRNNQIVFLSKW